jgi:hypothetical protein
MTDDAPDINDTLRSEGPDAVRARLDRAVRYNGGDGGTKAAPASSRLIQSSAEFVAGFRPPDYLVDGIIQRRFLYSMTAPPGAGKTCIALRIAMHAALG